MMKIKSLLIAMIAICLTMGFTSCSNDEPVDEPIDEPVDGEVFTYNVNSVQFNMYMSREAPSGWVLPMSRQRTTIAMRPL